MVSIVLPFAQECLCYPEYIVKRIFSRPRDNTMLTPNFFNKWFCRQSYIGKEQDFDLDALMKWILLPIKNINSNDV